MNLRVFKILSFFIFLGIVLAYPSLGDSYSYGPACQWIRLYGTVELPLELAAKGPPLLTVTYQTEEQNSPAFLLIRYPLVKKDFVFVLSGFAENIEGVIFLPALFSFNEAVKFQYFVTSADGSYRSPIHESEYSPIRKKVNGEVFCQSAIRLDPIVSKSE